MCIYETFILEVKRPDNDYFLDFGVELSFGENDGDRCYAVQSGEFEISIDEVNVKTLGKGSTFGELAMLYNVKRTATVKCKQTGVLWEIYGRTFKKVMKLLQGRSLAHVVKFFSDEPDFATLSDADKKSLASICSVQKFDDNKQILRRDDPGDWLLIIQSGRVRSQYGEGSELMLEPGSVCGGVSLMHNWKNYHNSRADGNVVCLALARNGLAKLNSNIKEVLKRASKKGVLKNLDFYEKLDREQQNYLVDVVEECECVVAGRRPALGNNVPRIPRRIITKKEKWWSKGKAELRPAASHNGNSSREVTAGCCVGEEEFLDNRKIDFMLTATSAHGLHVFAIKSAAFLEKLRNSFNMVHPLYDVSSSSPAGRPPCVRRYLEWNEIRSILQEIYLFKTLTKEQLSRVVMNMSKQSFDAFAKICTFGDSSDNFYLIGKGSVSVEIPGKGVVRTLSRWEYFGERGLLFEIPRSATITAAEPTTCLMLQKQVFLDIVGPFRQSLVNRIELQDETVKKDDLEPVAVVGYGTFGRVFLVRNRKSPEKEYALKAVSKKHVVAMQQENSINIERKILLQLYHPCIVQFVKTFQDEKNVYFLTEFLGGGDLFNAIREIGNLSEFQARYYSASIILAIEYLHEKGIMYRDLKPENLLLDFDGCVKLVDFGCCKQASRSYTLMGTPEYIAPEVILGRSYTDCIDWWSTGVCMYEFICGPLPFGGDTDDQLELFRQIIEAPLRFPSWLRDQNAKSIITGLMQKNPEERLGGGVSGAKEIKRHPYFKKFDFDGLLSRSVKSQWVPDREQTMKQWIDATDPGLLSLENSGEEMADGCVSMDWAKDF
ncbi:cGMP-dependent protein kinase, putative [Perkinsus marinus ATCC 50983]|uniref:cGMP-dependent protein kinase n=1 Tax=Perkinsus marinus (strain ATCC 50983 / TXsc) TaxID=423536 RepID=C5L5N2_PERM5|nr:cGMP-dependent protein kinase, putative [Perkinsus marinus ATCC 50983]EER07966.1 cGMP-dependent protein kinase, putative [Perkinsus marinus ATCC 50983]|eukprot:XP_002776150.1 cGMP-dependent protein kinase, putative [Perkinsus marinus ATCC 50983]